MRIGVLTSSRADFGIYLPLLKKFKENNIFFEIIAFGTHLSHFHGYTIKQIIENGFEVTHTVESLLLGDTEEAIATSVGLTTTKFSSFWKNYKAQFDFVFCLGDRYEMFAAVNAAIPFNIRFAHLHGGETTLGAIDNIFRHSISLASQVHFTSTEAYAIRLKNLLDVPEYIYNTGALSLDNLDSLRLLSAGEFERKWGINMEIPTILLTFHPETVESKKNSTYAHEVCEAIKRLKIFQFLITLPNADTYGNTIRSIFLQELSQLKHVKVIENLGTEGYFTAMKLCSMFVGNTSSGIIEAASFKKYVINLGNRQKGRLTSSNVFDCNIQSDSITKEVERISNLPLWTGENIYWNGGASARIIEVLKQISAN